MTVIVCVDDYGGILFNRRRVSLDRMVISDILKNLGSHPLRIREYSLKLFPVDAVAYVGDDYFTDAADDDIVFLEDVVADDIWEKADKIVVYCWNRHYPSDVKFPMDMLRERGRLESTDTFAGHSHSEITREVYAL